MIPIEVQIECIRRELGQRRMVYPRMVQRGTMTSAKAGQEIARMEAVLETLERIAKDGRLL